MGFASRFYEAEETDSKKSQARAGFPARRGRRVRPESALRPLEAPGRRALSRAESRNSGFR